MKDLETIPASFRDPSGYLFVYKGQLYRRILPAYKENYDRLIGSGLYDSLRANQFLIPHEEVDSEDPVFQEGYKTIRPELVKFISYPYEWCFGQLKDAALLTLKIEEAALAHDMSLKDCSGYNVQFKDGRPVFIDTLSFEKYREGEPWVAYRQFCQHFLAPLALMSLRDVRLNQLLRVYIDGIPLDLASSLLPSRTWFRVGLLLHLHMHSKSQKKFEGKSIRKEKYRVARSSLLGLIAGLKSLVENLKWNPEGTEWAGYYERTNYSSRAMTHKEKMVAVMLDRIDPGVVWDLGANDGHFSRLIADRAEYVASFDVDPAAVESNYRECARTKEGRVLPLLMDLTNPSPGVGWENSERTALLNRSGADTVLALALVHHLAISNNLPLSRIAGFFAKICRFLVIEFVPKEDSQVQRLLSTREDIFPDYTREGFEKSFSVHFDVKDPVGLEESDRLLYLMERKAV